MNRPYILTVDDDSDLNNYISMLLKKHAIEVHTTTKAEDFLKQLKKRTPDLCIIDLNLDRAFGAGFQLIQAIRKIRGYDLPLLVLSRRSGREDITHALELGANDFLAKPLDDTIFINKLNSYLDLKEQDVSLVHYKVGQRDQECSFTLSLAVESITEFGITLRGRELLSRGSTVWPSGEFAKELFGSEKEQVLTVTKSWMDEDSRDFLSFIEFDFEDIKVYSNIRSFILRENARRGR